MHTLEQKGAAGPIGKIGQRRQVVIPKHIFDALQLRTGDFVEVRRVQGTVVIKPKKLVDADQELTPRQRRIIDRRLALAEQDVKMGRMSGPFGNVAELKRHLHAAVRARL